SDCSCPTSLSSSADPHHLPPFPTRRSSDLTNEQVAGMLSDELGGFSFNNLASGTYILRITFVGYENHEEEIPLATGENKNLETISLKPASSEVLDEVVIEAELPDMRLGIDRKVFNVSQSLISEGGSAT